MTPIPRCWLASISATAMLMACTPPAGNESASGVGADSTAHVVEAPKADALLALEKQALDAYLKGNGAHFQKILSDKLVMQMGGSRISKADVVNMISGVHCQVRDGWALTEPRLSRIDADTYAISYRTTIDGSCTAAGVTEKLPSPVRTSSIWVRDGAEWKAVFHGEIPIPDPVSEPAGDTESQPEEVATAQASGSAAPVTPASDPISDTLMAAERAIWDAWMKKDADTISRLMAGEAAFVNLFGTYLPDRDSAVAEWTSEACEVSSFMLGNAVGSLISPTIGILTVTGKASGTCGGQDISAQRIHATTVYVKDGDAWKWAFGFNSPK